MTSTIPHPEYGMTLAFPAMQGRMGKREYYVTLIKLALVPKLFKFRDWAELPPEQRAQRVIQKNRVPEITQYILDNEDGYLFSSLTASFNTEPTFTPIQGHPNLGLLQMPFEADLIINDGQHRRAAIEEALKENPMLGQETISVVLFPWEDLDRVQQMFSDLNRTARKTSKSLDILYNHRDLMSQVALTVSERLPVFRNYVDKDRISLALRSPKLFTLGAIFDGTEALLGVVTEGDYEIKLAQALSYWEAVRANLPEWGRVETGVLAPSELRQEYINSHAVVLSALGTMGRQLVAIHPHDWVEKLSVLRNIDWRRTNPEWQGVAMSGTDVINRRQSRMDMASLLKRKLGLTLTPSEDRSLRGANQVMDDLKAQIGKGYVAPLTTPSSGPISVSGRDSQQLSKDFQNPPDVQNTEIINAHFGDESVTNWAALLKAAIRAAYKQGMTRPELFPEGLTVKIRVGVHTQGGYSRVPQTNLSFQGMNANNAFKNALILAQHLRVQLSVRYKLETGHDEIFEYP